MKKVLFILPALILTFGATSCGNNKEGKEDKNGGDVYNFPNSAKVEVIKTDKTQRVGTDKLGYVDIPNEWAKFKDLDPKVTDLQYSDPTGTTILTMNIVDKSPLSKEEALKFGPQEAATNVWKNLEAAGCKVEGGLGKFADYDAFELYATYNKGSQLAAWLFQSKNGEIHYIAVESPSEKEFTNLFEMVSKTYSLKK